MDGDGFGEFGGFDVIPALIVGIATLGAIGLGLSGLYLLGERLWSAL